jgi:hypothetical protein
MFTRTCHWWEDILHKLKEIEKEEGKAVKH